MKYESAAVTPASADWHPKALPRAPRAIWILSRLAAVLVPVAIGLLLWLLHTNDLDEQRATLISDVLWLEQNLRFQMERNQEQLRLLGADAFDARVSPASYSARAQTLLQSASGLVQIVRLNRRGAVTHALPSWPETHGGVTAHPQVDEAIRLARGLDKPVYTQPFAIGDNEARFALLMPHFRGESLKGIVVGVYSMHALLNQVPWWFTEKYRLVVADHNGGVLASKSRVNTADSELSYQLTFDPPGHGLRLVVAAHHHRTRLLPALLMLTIVLLSVAILISLWVVRRHVQRRHAAEKALREEYAFRKAMEDSVHTGLRARDLSGRVVYVNPAFCQMVGWPAEELIGRRPPMPYWPEEEKPHIYDVHNRILAGSGAHEAVELRFKRKNGEYFDALIYEAPLIDANGEHNGWMGSMLDITERKRAEELNRQQQDKLQFTARLVTMGEMASTLAHELNQPLSAISSYATGCLNLYQGRAGASPDVSEALSKIVQQAQRAGQVIRRVHEFVRRREPEQELCHMNSVVEDAVGLIEVIAQRRNVPITLALTAALPAVHADKVMIEQVLLNLIRNGMDAMALTPLARRLLTVRTAAEERGVRVSVGDCGPGIPADVAAQLYQPFFSTKQEGMGMGLNICRSIAELHHGRLWFETAPGGTQFHLWLPPAA
jgi:two-component system, LuxR family, sensor histidine kinase DctS